MKKETLIESMGKGKALFESKLQNLEQVTEAEEFYPDEILRKLAAMSIQGLKSLPEYPALEKLLKSASKNFVSKPKEKAPDTVTTVPPAKPLKKGVYKDIVADIKSITGYAAQYYSNLKSGFIRVKWYWPALSEKQWKLVSEYVAQYPGDMLKVERAHGHNPFEKTKKGGVNLYIKSELK